MTHDIDEFVRGTFSGPIDENWNLFACEDICAEWESSMWRGEVMESLWRLTEVTVKPESARIELIVNQKLRVIDQDEDMASELRKSPGIIFKTGDVLSLRVVVPTEERHVEVHLLGERLMRR